MWEFIRQSGPFILLQFLLALVILVLTLINAVRLARPSGRRSPGLPKSIDAILFWGCLTAIFGFLGQWVGLNRATHAVAQHGAVNPSLVILGIGESLGTTVFGLFTLVVAAFFWFALRVVQRRQPAA